MALPTASVAVAVAVKVPAAPYAWVTLAPGAPVPSPKVHAIDAGDDQLSLAAAEKGAAPRLPEGSENAVKRGPPPSKPAEKIPPGDSSQAVSALPSASTATSPSRTVVSLGVPMLDRAASRPRSRWDPWATAPF